jgi:uncharacterized protein YjbJ (UPF0337 family)
MSAENKAASKARAAKGKVKKGAGKAVGNPRMQAEGRADQTAGNLRQAGEKAKDAFKK